MKKIKTPLLLIVTVLIMLLVIYSPYIINNVPFEYGGDLKPQGFPFFIEFKNLINFSKILQGILPFYSWNHFLGTNWWASKAFYLMGDIFSYISLMIPAHFYTVYAIITGLKVMVAAILFYAYMRVLKFKPKISIIGAISYAFSSWIIYFYGQTTFISYYALFPLLLLSIEIYLTKKKLSLFIISTSILLFTNFLFFYSSSLFLPIYFIYRYFQLNQNFKGFIKSTVSLILGYLIGVLITAVLILPTFSYILGNDRVGNANLNLFFDDIRIYLHLLSASFVPSHVFIYNTNVFETNYHISREILIWSGSLTALLLPQLFAEKNRTKRISQLLFYITLIVLILMPIGNSAFNGFSEFSFRWTYIIIAMNIVHALSYLENIDQKALKHSLMFILILLVGIVPITLLLLNQLSLFTQYLNQWILFIYVGIWIIVFYVILIKNYQHKWVWISLVVVIESLQFAYFNLSYFRIQPLFNWEQIESATHVLQDQEYELDYFLNNLEVENNQQYYRVYIPHDSIYWSYSHNMSSLYQMNGLMTYDSTYAPSINDLKRMVPEITEFGSDWIFNIKDGNLMNFLSVKYAITVKESEIPFTNYEILLTDYRGSLIVSKNLDYVPLGRTYTQKLLIGKDLLSDTNDLNKYLVLNEDLFYQLALKNTEQNFLEDINYYDNTLTGSINSSDESVLLIALPYDKGWKVYVNDQEVDVFKANGGFISFKIPQGQSDIRMYFVPYGFKTGFMLSVLGTLLFMYILFIDLKPKIFSNLFKKFKRS